MGPHFNTMENTVSAPQFTMFTKLSSLKRRTVIALPAYINCLLPTHTPAPTSKFHVTFINMGKGNETNKGLLRCGQDGGTQCCVSSVGLWGPVGGSHG